MSVADELGKLKKLADDGIISQSEFTIQKRKLLSHGTATKADVHGTEVKTRYSGSRLRLSYMLACGVFFISLFFAFASGSPFAITLTIALFIVIAIMAVYAWVTGVRLKGF